MRPIKGQEPRPDDRPALGHTPGVAFRDGYRDETRWPPPPGVQDQTLSARVVTSYRGARPTIMRARRGWRLPPPPAPPCGAPRQSPGARPRLRHTSWPQPQPRMSPRPCARCWRGIVIAERLPHLSTGQAAIRQKIKCQDKNRAAAG